MNHLHLRIQIIPEIISKSNSCTKFTLQVLQQTKYRYKYFSHEKFENSS